ncbi:MAG: glycoside hydrolase family 2 [Treponema sp.]|jgi:hypothetical protein|nr:glycoside hydrolase family 2 [Treponema sp.]
MVKNSVTALPKTLLTRWGKKLDREHPWPEYPRPQLERENWLNLNGPWECRFVEGPPAGKAPALFDGTIIVPFSPESALAGGEPHPAGSAGVSGAGRQLLPGATLWYRRSFNALPPENGGRLLLNFGAVDQRCVVYCNGQPAGAHEGGYWPFTLDITELLRDGENTITLAVTDDSNCGKEAWGKQSLSRGGMWYTAQSGIWQTVWIETAPRRYIRSLKITPLYDEGAVEVELDYAAAESAVPEARLAVYDGEALAASVSGMGPFFRIPLPDFKSWSPASPFLYTLRIEAGDDRVKSYFGMRKFSIVEDEKGSPRLALNNKPIFHSGLLDQGYWSDGLYTAPSDEAIVWELSELKRLGFNMLRKHIKVEPLRWYYHCDRLGIMVWQDLVSGGGPYKPMVTMILPFLGINLKDANRSLFARADPLGRRVFERDMKNTVELLRNTVSIAVWGPFNEGWGQFDALRITEELRRLDPHRLIDHASGWHDQRGGDLYSRHVYFRAFRFRADRPRKGKRRVPVLSEFGGYSCPAPHHMVMEKPYGYRMFNDKRGLSLAFEKLYREEILPATVKGLSAAIYTQVSDVEDEINGIFTYDRELLKIDEDTLIGINRELLGVANSKRL